MVFLGKRSFSLRGSSVASDCVFDFRGKAAETLTGLHELYVLGDWGKREVRLALRGILDRADRDDLQNVDASNERLKTTSDAQEAAESS